MDKNTNTTKEENEDSNKTDRININDYYRKEEDNALHQHTDENKKDLDKNLNEQMGGTDNTVTSEPNNI